MDHPFYVKGKGFINAGKLKAVMRLLIRRAVPVQQGILSFEYFVPDGWEGKYQDFEKDIPRMQRYWLDENGKNLIGE